MATDARALPSRLASAPADIRAEFDRFKHDLLIEIDRRFKAPFSLPPVPGIALPRAGRVHVPFGQTLVVDTSAGNVNVQLPMPGPKDSGRFVGILRLSTSNNVTCWAPVNTTIVGDQELTLPSAARLYLWYFSTIHGAGSTFVPVNDA